MHGDYSHMIQLIVKTYQFTATCKGKRVVALNSNYHFGRISTRTLSRIYALRPYISEVMRKTGGYGSLNALLLLIMVMHSVLQL